MQLEGRIGVIQSESETTKGSDILQKKEITNHAENIQKIFKERCRAQKKA